MMYKLVLISLLLFLVGCSSNATTDTKADVSENLPVYKIVLYTSIGGHFREWKIPSNKHPFMWHPTNNYNNYSLYCCGGVEIMVPIGWYVECTEISIVL